MAPALQEESVNLQDLKKEKENASLQEKGKDFDDILELVGSEGKYQRMLLYGILVPLSIFEAIIGLNLWFLLDDPPHWCHVPGREASGLDLYAWRNLTIPKEPDGRFSKCEMYSGNNSVVLRETSACTSGWEYDVSDVNGYRSLVADFDWVCDQGLYATWVLTAQIGGRALGTLFMGWLSDKLGRKTAFIIILSLFTFGRGLALCVPGHIWLFVGLSFLVGMGSPMFAITNNTIALELSGETFRAWIITCTWMTVVIGVVAVPALALLVPNWIYLGWITVSIGALSYLLLPWLPESPRWLLTKGRVDEVVKILKEIGRWNGTSGKVSEEELKSLLEKEDARRVEGEVEEESGWKLFSSRNMAKNTVLVIFAWVMNGLVFHGLNLNSLNLHGHRYLNFVLLTLVEIPASYFGCIISDKVGRRWAQVGFFLMCVAGCVAAAGFSGDESTSGVVKLLCAANFAKFAIAMSFLVIYVQANELFPTMLRTTGAGLASTTASVMKLVVPYIVYAGKSSITLPWIMSGIFAGAGMVAAAFIPETKNHKLPETISDAENIGKGAKFWSFRLPKKSEDGLKVL